MNVLFIYSFADIETEGKPIRSWTAIQFGISYISSLLKERGHNTQLVVLRSNTPVESYRIVESIISDSTLDIICFTAVYTQFSFIKDVASRIYQLWPEIFQVIGGTHATLNPEEIVDGPFNAICVGEGEYPVLELCAQLQTGEYPNQIMNLWIKSKDGEIQRNNSREFIQDLDNIPFPDRKMWEPWVIEQEHAEFSILLGRGCPFDCTYCSNHALRTISTGKYVRVRSPENIIAEISSLYSQYNIRKIYLEVESIAVFKPWAMELCIHLCKFNADINNAIEYGCNIRISNNIIDDNLFYNFWKAGIKYINIGLESGSERLRAEVLKRNYTNQQFIDTVALARKHGMKVYTYNLIGIPGETIKEYYETVNLNRECQPEGLNTSIFFPYPGTELHKVCIDQGLINEINHQGSERQFSILKLPNFSNRQIINALNWMNYRVYKGHKPKLTMFIHVITVQIRSNSITNYIYRYFLRMKLISSLRDLFRMSWKY